MIRFRPKAVQRVIMHDASELEVSQRHGKLTMCESMLCQQGLFCISLLLGVIEFEIN